jgi:hypothetical protein
VPKNEAAELRPRPLRQLILAQPSTSLFETEQENRYFSLFSERIAAEICPYFNPDVWSRMILQACASEASIRHAAVAIGALGKTYEFVQSGSYPKTGSNVSSTFERLPSPGESRSAKGGSPPKELAVEAYGHHRAALEQYDKAIKRMRNDIALGNQTLRNTLIICIVIICFEAIHGNHMSAAGQVQSGLRLIQDWSSKQPNSRKHPQGFSSPSPETVDDFLVQTFGRMEIQSMSVFDPRPVSAHMSLKTEGQEAVQAMPKQFSSIEQARIYLDLIIRRAMHFNASIQVRATDGSTELTNPTNPGPMPWIDGRIPSELKDRAVATPEIQAEQTSLMAELVSWKEAFKPLLIFARTAGGIDAVSALAMSISAVTSQISLRAAFFIDESSYDIFFPEFKTVVDYSASLLAFQTSLSQMKNKNDEEAAMKQQHADHRRLLFAFEIGIIPPLYSVIIKCRDSHTRHAALKLLEKYPRREGVWDSVVVAALGAWVIELEEGGTRWPSVSSDKSCESNASADESVARSEGWGEGRVVTQVPEEKRVRKAKIRFNLLERRSNMSCFQIDLAKGLYVERKEVFTW